jgi:glutamine amidotransferase-like uncharacterized protein
MRAFFLLPWLACCLGSLAHAEPAPSATKLKVILYNDKGAFGKGVPRITELLGRSPDIEVVKLNAEQLRTQDWSDARVVIFSGGSGSEQSKTIGSAGGQKVRAFVEKGGGYIGICGGAYLACEGFSWGLKVLDAKTVSKKWKRGEGSVSIEFTDKGRQILGFPASESRNIRYANGPIYCAANIEAIPDFEPLAFFRTELAENGSPKGAMVNTPAMVAAPFGKGRVLCSSPHPEQTDGLEGWIEKAVRWVAGSP